MQDERQQWNRRYGSGSHHSLESDPLLPEAYREFIAPLFPDGGSALDVAGGVGRHALWLSQHGWHVRLVDVSDVGVSQAQALARERAASIDFQVADLESCELGVQRYELVLVFFYLQRELVPRLVKALKPGGLLIYKTYTQLALQFGRGPSHPMHLLGENELLRMFSGLTVLYYKETVQGRGIAELVARKPATSEG